MKKPLQITIVSTWLLASLAACGPTQPSDQDQAKDHEEQESRRTDSEIPILPFDQPAPDEQTTTPATPEEKYNLTNTYFGDQITLVCPHAKNFGSASIRGEDAKALYQAMAFAPSKIKANEVWLAGLKKEGFDVVCFEMARKATPEQKEFACNVYFDYRSGAVAPRPNPSYPDNQEAIFPSEDYQGKNLVLIAGHPSDLGILTLEGPEAKILYDTLTAEPRAENNPDSSKNEHWITSETKLGLGYSCHRLLKKTDANIRNYSCSFELDYKAGQVVRPRAP